MEVCFQKGVGVGNLGCCRVYIWGEKIAKDSRIQSSSEPGRTKIWVRTDPIILKRLICVENERIALASINLDGIDCQRLDVDTVDLYDSLRITR
jgi:hypothetical protein